ncbi:MAG: hypothetical protein ABMA00_09120, partial [Gemmatimonas sp.]
SDVGRDIAPRRHQRVARRFVVASALTLLVTACGDRRVAGDNPYAAIVADAVPRIEQQLGLKFKAPPKVESRTRDEVAKFVMQQLTSERAKTQIEGQQSAYRVLGLSPDTLDLADLLQRLLEEQVIGYYDPATKVLYVVDGAPQALLQQTVTHELVHALQDQYVRIDSIQGLTENADGQGAAQAILEGQAVFTQLLVDPNSGPMIRMPGGWDRIRDVIRDGQDGMPVFSAAPRAVREGLLFPYLGGADFVRRFSEKRPMKELLTDLPISTRQILNDDAYFTDDKSKREVPTSVTLPPPSTGSVLYSNTFGEFETRLVLVQHLKDELLARRGAGGIDGDRYAVIRTAQGDALVWASVWDSSVDAADFMDLLANAMLRRYDMRRQVVPAGATTRRIDAPAAKTRGARTVTISVEQRQGRPVVFYMDTPAGISTTLMDPTRLTIGR